MLRFTEFMGFFFLINLAEAFVPYYTGQTLDSILVQQNFSSFKSNVVYFILAHFMRYQNIGEICKLCHYVQL